MSAKKKPPDEVQVYDGMPMEERLIKWAGDEYDGHYKVKCCDCSLRHLWTVTIRRSKRVKEMTMILRAYRI